MINATDTAEITIHATNIRYGLTIFKIGNNISGSMQLQRSQKNIDGTWIDDPRPNSSISVEIDSTLSAVSDIVNLIPSILNKLTVTDTYEKCMIKIIGTLTNGILDVSIKIQDLFDIKKVTFVPSLNTFLTQNQDVALSILTAWDNLDAAINIANSQNLWL